MSKYEEAKQLIRESMTDFENHYKKAVEDLEAAIEGKAGAGSVGELQEKLNKMDERQTEIQKALDELSVEIKSDSFIQNDDEKDTLDKQYEDLFNEKILRGKGLNDSEEDIVKQYVEKTFAVGNAANQDGGYLVPTQNATDILTQVEMAVPFFNISTVVDSSLDNPEFLVQNAKGASAHGTETSTVSDTATPTVQAFNVKTWHFEAEPWITRQLINDSIIDVQAFIKNDVVQALSDDLGNQLVNGDGTTEPLGILTAGNAVSAWNQVGQVAAANGDNFAIGFDLDDLYTLKYSVDRRYKTSGQTAWVCGDQAIAGLRKMRDANGQYLWQPTLTVGEPSNFDGEPLFFTPYMPALTGVTGEDALIYGNFRQGHIIVRRPNALFVIVDEITNKKYVKLYHSMRAGASTYDARALRILTTKAKV